MKFLSDNCIREIKAPDGKINCFDYSSELNLIASFQYNSEIALVWNPDTGEVVKEIDLMECHADILLLPEGRYIAVAWDEAHHGSGVAIYSIDSGEEVLELGDNETYNGDCVALALTPENNVLAGSGFYEYKIDYKNMKVLEKRLIYQGAFYMCMCMCCSRSSYTILSVGDDEDSSEGVTCVNVKFSSSGEPQTSEEIIKHCFIDGEKIDFKDNVVGLAHDGENVIIATGDQIIALESATDGIVGHVIVSSGISSDGLPAVGQLKFNDKGQLMVCNGTDVISVYQYKDVNTLQGLCRRTINSMLKQRKDKVADLPLPNSIKSYLSYKA